MFGRKKEEAITLRQAKSEIRRAVRKGASLLDERHPRWFEQIELDALSLQSSSYCICGQLDAVKRGMKGSSGEGEWESGLKRLFGRWVDTSRQGSRDETHGFVVPMKLDEVMNAHSPYGGDISEGWEYAEGIWKTHIVNRRRAKKRGELAEFVANEKALAHK